MKSINVFILERLKINKDIDLKGRENLIDYIFEILNIENDEEDARKLISKWLIRNKISEVQFLTTSGSLWEISGRDRDTFNELKKIITTDSKKCEELYNRYYEDIQKYMYHNDLSGFDDYCNIGDYGYIQELFVDKDLIISISNGSYIYLMKKGEA